MLVAGGCYHLINRGNNKSVVFRRPADYWSFLALIDCAQERQPLSLLDYCLMPNHFHLVVSPYGPHDVSRWMHWLTTTHTHRHHLLYGTSGSLWQGRFRSFPIKSDIHLLTVMRYVERNALRAGLVEKAEDWPWGSLALRVMGHSSNRLAEPPVNLPTRWVELVNESQSPIELEALRKCVNRQRPFGDPRWVEETSQPGCIARPKRPRGRPPKKIGA